MIDPDAVGEAHRNLIPVGMARVVDRTPDSRRDHALEFCVAARSGHDFGSKSLGNLRRENGHTAGALREYDLVRLQRTYFDERKPGRQSRDRKRRCFDLAQRVGYRDGFVQIMYSAKAPGSGPPSW